MLKVPVMPLERMCAASDEADACSDCEQVGRMYTMAYRIHMSTPYERPQHKSAASYLSTQMRTVSLTPMSWYCMPSHTLEDGNKTANGKDREGDGLSR